MNIQKKIKYTIAALCKHAYEYLVRNSQTDFWHEEIRSHTQNHKLLTVEQRKLIHDYFKPYFKPTYIAHNYFTEVSGKFYVNYIPHDQYFKTIDPYFNDWNRAKYMANKCLTRRLFKLKDGEMPRHICCRMNGIWYDTEDNVITYNHAISLMKSEGKIFVKAAEDSCGGHGVTFVDTSSDNCDIESVRQYRHRSTGRAETALRA